MLTYISDFIHNYSLSVIFSTFQPLLKISKISSELCLLATPYDEGLHYNTASDMKIPSTILSMIMDRLMPNVTNIEAEELSAIFVFIVLSGIHVRLYAEL